MKYDKGLFGIGGKVIWFCACFAFSSFIVLTSIFISLQTINECFKVFNKIKQTRINHEIKL